MTLRCGDGAIGDENIIGLRLYCNNIVYNITDLRVQVHSLWSAFHSLLLHIILHHSVSGAH